MPARGSRALHKHRARVAAEVMVDLVVLAPEPAVGRHGQEQMAAGGRDAAQLAQGPGVVLDVLEHVGGADEVEAPVVVGKRLEARLAYAGQAARAAEVHRSRRGLHALCATEPRVILEVAPGAAAGVKDSRRNRKVDPGEQCTNHGSSPAEPPVAVLEIVELRVEPVLHERHPRPKKSSTRL